MHQVACEVAFVQLVQDLTPIELVNLRYGRDAIPELQSRDEVLPLLDTKTIRDAIVDIDAKLERASATEIDDLLDQKTKLQKYLANGRAKRPGADRSHQPAHFPDESKRAMDSVRKAIKEATDKMAANKALASLAAHLDSNIRFGTSVSYVGSIAWTVELGVFPRKKS
jgi:hypothetical protein